MTSFWHAWNKDIYESNYYEPREAVVNRKKKIPKSKDFEHYESVLTDIMNKNSEVLKKNGFMILTFNNNNFRSWISILFSICKAGFEIDPDKLHFQPGVKNYKQTAHTISQGTVHGDFVLFFRNEKKQQKKNVVLSEEVLGSIRGTLGKVVKNQSLSSEDFHDEFVSYYRRLLPDLWSYLSSIDQCTTIEEITSNLLVD